MILRESGPLNVTVCSGVNGPNYTIRLCGHDHLLQALPQNAFNILSFRASGSNVVEVVTQSQPSQPSVFFIRTGISTIAEISAEQAQAFEASWNYLQLATGKSPTAIASQVEFKATGTGDPRCIFTDLTTNKTYEGFPPTGVALAVPVLVAMDFYPGVKKISMPDQTCRCPIKNLLSTGHDDGCPEKRR